MAQRITVQVPDLGDFSDVEVIDVLVKPGDAVEVEQALVSLETDKATMDVPTTVAGRVVEVLVAKGARVSKGHAIVVLETAADEAPAAEAAAAPVKAAVAPASAAPAAAVAAPAEIEHEVRVPELGDFKDVEIIELQVAVGDSVAVEGALLTLETEKATMDVPSPVAGTVSQLHVAKGDRVNPGDRVATIRGTAAPAAVAAATPAAAPAERASAPAPQRAAAAPPAAATPVAVPEGAPRAHAGPSVRRLARELGVDLARVSGSGIKGRVTHDDVKAWVKRTLTQGTTGAAALPRVPEVDFASFGPVEVKPLGRIQKISGARLQASWVNLPHVTQHEEADITELEALRAGLKDKASELGIKLTPLAFIARACLKVLSRMPQFNSSLDASGQNLVFKQYLHLGFAADTPGGLVVPVIRDANRKDVYELARELARLAGKARDGKLSGAEMQGGCFTISSLGGIGGTSFTPIINAPEVAILGVSKARMQPVWQDGAFVPRLMLPLSLSYDHRVIDGAEAVRFTVAVAEELAAPQGLVEAVP